MKPLNPTPVTSIPGRVLSGEFIVVNKHLLEDLVKLGLWNDELKDAIMRANGSIQNIDIIPQDLKELYKTVWEMSMKDIIDMSRHRGYFIDQSQSLNLFMEGSYHGKIDLDAFLCLEERFKNRYVLPKNQIGGRCD